VINTIPAGSRRIPAATYYRNLDGNRPSRATDAYPVERYAFELSLPTELSGGGSWITTPHLEYGIGRNIELGFAAEVPLRRGGTTVFELGGLWNVRRETPALPAFSLVFEASQPTGGARFGGDATVGVGLVATRSFGRSRAHLNGMVSPIRPDSGEAGPVWWAGLAWDYTFFRSSTLTVVDLVAERPLRGARVEWTAGLGLRRQLLPTWVLHTGVSQSLEGGDVPTRFHIGASHAFALAGLMRRGAR
jgi:hypothetical protein